MLTPRFFCLRHIVTTLLLCLIFFAACQNPSNNGPSNNGEPPEKPGNPDENTWVEFNNLEEFPVTIYSDPARQVVFTEIPATGTKKVPAEPAPAGRAFYPTFRLMYPIGTTGTITIPYNGPSIIAAVAADKTNTVSIPKLESIEINSAYVMLINNSSFSLTFNEGPLEKSPLGGGPSIINSGLNAAYEVAPGPVSVYSILRNASVPVAFPAGLSEFKAGIIYVLTYNGTVLTLTSQNSILQTVPPAVPANVRVEAVSSSSAQISWDSVYGATSYRVYRATGSATTSYSQITNIAALSWIDSGLAEGQVYYYKVSAVSGINMASGQSAAVAAVMPPANVQVSAVTTISVTLAWNGINGASGYNVYRSAGENGVYTKVNSAEVSGTSFTDTGLSPDTGYYYKVSAIAGGVEGFQSNPVSADTLTSVPSNLRVTAVTTISVNLAWEAVSEASGYNVYRSAGENGMYTKVNSATVSGTSFTDTGLEAFTRYYYRVSAIVGGVESVRSDAVSGLTLLPAPGNVQANLIPGGSISLTWNALNGADSYDIYRSGNEEGTYTKVNSGAVTGAAFTDTGVAPYADYYYRVTATAAGVEGALSNPVPVRAEITVPGANLAAKLAWLQANAVSGSSYYIEVSADESLAPSTLSYSDSVITIMLNGSGTMRTVNLSSRGRLFIIDSGVTLILGNNITLRGRSDNNAPLVRVNSGGALEMRTGSVITGNSSTSGGMYYGGGGVQVASGTFTMNGGKISGNSVTPPSSSSTGGGVHVDRGIFTMNGGEISGNSSSSNSSSEGGGVYVTFNGTFTMNSGKISGNTATSSKYSTYGGGVYNYGTFTMSGGEISGNTADAGGGVYKRSGTFTMSGGEISGNSAADGGGVCVGGGTFTMDGGKISGNTASGGGGVLVTQTGFFTMSDGEISGNTASDRGGGVFHDSETFTMSGGEISGNSASNYGGGVYVDIFSKTFTKTGGGTVYGYASGVTKSNVVKNSSGVVQNNSGHAVYVYKSSSVNYRRESTAGPTVNLDSAVAGTAGGWE